MAKKPDLDVGAAAERSGALLAMLIEGSLLGTAPDPQAFLDAVRDTATDSLTLNSEVRRLREQRQAIRDLHMPVAADGPAVCGGCSIGGGQVRWPCETWKLTDKDTQ
jgi:hypothetical protein